MMDIFLGYIQKKYGINVEFFKWNCRSLMRYLKVHKFIAGGALLLLFALMVSCTEDADSYYGRVENLGFFTPDGLNESMGMSDYSIINLHYSGGLTLKDTNLPKALDKIRNTDHKLIINLSVALFPQRHLSDIDVSYPGGGSRNKEFSPEGFSKVFTARDEKTVEDSFELIMTDLKKDIDKVKYFLVADEPYINGVTKIQLEQTVSALKRVLKKNNLKTPIMINFAGALFNSEFAHVVDGQLWDYVERIDNHYKSKSVVLSGMSVKEKAEFSGWVDAISKFRLVSYDQAGNIYTGGGIPKGIDVVSFDFYLSTLLLDEMYDTIPGYFFDKGFSDYCGDFEGKKISDIRGKLSFLGENGGGNDKDKLILNNLFDCRMMSTYQLLEDQIEKDFEGSDYPEIMLIGESSSNGFIGRSFSGEAKKQQDKSAVELRVLDEVKRYVGFYDNALTDFTAGASFFLYSNSYDQSINLEIFGVEGMESVKTYIREAQ